MPATVLAPEHRSAVRQLAAIELAQRSFADYSRFLRTDEGVYPYDWPMCQGVADALGTDRDILLLKRRQVLASWTLGAYLDWVVRFHPGWMVGAVSIGQKFADELGRKIRQVSRMAPAWAGPPGANERPITYANGNECHVFPSTETAGVSFTLSDYLMDEVSKHRYARLNRDGVYPSLYKPRPGVERRRGRLIMASTTHPDQGRSGFMWEEWNAATGRADVFWPESETFKEWADRNAVDGELPNTIPIFLSRWCRPDQQGAAWWEAEKERMLRKGVDGMPLDLTAIDAYYPEQPEDAFVGRGGLVYPQFSKERHVREGDPVPWEACAYRLAAYDLGGSDMTAFVFLGAYRRPGDRWRIHQYGEWGRREVLTAERANEVLMQWHREDAPLHFIESDPREPTLCATLAGAYGWPAQLANWKREEGLGVVGAWLDSDALTINSRCGGSISEFPVYKRVERMDPVDGVKVVTATPSWTHADWMDARRYGMMRLHYFLANEGADEPQYTEIRW